MQRGQRDRAAGVRGDPRLVVLRLDPRGEIDRARGVRHAVAVVGLHRRIVDHRGGPDLAEVEMRVDEGLGDEPSARVDRGRRVAVEALGDSRDPAGGDADVAGVPGAQPGATDQQVVARCHGKWRTISGGSAAALR